MNILFIEELLIVTIIMVIIIANLFCWIELFALSIL